MGCRRLRKWNDSPIGICWDTPEMRLLPTFHVHANNSSPPSVTNPPGAVVGGPRPWSNDHILRPGRCAPVHLQPLYARHVGEQRWSDLPPAGPAALPHSESAAAAAEGRGRWRRWPHALLSHGDGAPKAGVCWRRPSWFHDDSSELVYDRGPGRRGAGRRERGVPLGFGATHARCVWMRGTVVGEGGFP